MTQEMSPLKTANHRCYVGEAGVTIFSTDRLDEEDQLPVRDALLQLAPEEALAIAEYVVERREALLARQRVVDAQLELVSQELLAHFPDLWAQYAKARPGISSMGIYQDFDVALHHAATHLRIKETSQAYRWFYTPTDHYTLELREALFWRYFNRHHKNHLLESYLPSHRTGERRETDE